MTRIGILGGTGAMGRALALLLSKGNEVMIGSRSPAKAVAAAAEVPRVRGGSNGEVAEWCEVAIVAVPFRAMDGLKKLAGPLARKLVMSMVNPLKAEAGVLQYGLAEGSAAEQVSLSLPRSRVATAFNNVPVAFFRGVPDQTVDVLVAAESRETFEEAASVIRGIPHLRALYVGPLSQAQSVERLTVLVLNAGALNGSSRLSVRFVPPRKGGAGGQAPG